jgi:uncharacterized protein YegP (UPF0339 family)
VRKEEKNMKEENMKEENMKEENRVEEHEPTHETAAEPEMPAKFQTEPEPEPGYEMGYLVENVPGDEEVGKLEPLTREARQELKKDPFQAYQDAKGEWRWRLLSPENGLILGDSAEGYYSKSGAQRAIRGVKTLIRNSV